MARLVVIEEKTKDSAELLRVVLQPRLAGPERALAVTAIRDLNPEVDLDKLRVGEVLVIPETPGFNPSVGESLDKGGLTDDTDSLREALRETLERFEAARASRTKETEDVVAALRLVVKRHPEGKERIDQALKTLKATRQNETEADARVEKNLHDLAAGLRRRRR